MIRNLAPTLSKVPGIFSREQNRVKIGSMGVKSLLLKVLVTTTDGAMPLVLRLFSSKVH